jgi:3-hydroxyanthranilate 3,4-dioxygenase
MQPLRAFNFQQWLEQAPRRLKPPVCNQVVFEDAEFIVMVVGGPNSRTDYHWDPGEELLLPARGRHAAEDRAGRPESSTSRSARARCCCCRRRAAFAAALRRYRRAGHRAPAPSPDEQDGFMWFCEQCGHKLYEEYLHVSDIVAQLPPIFDRFYGDPAHLRCEACGHEMPPR